MKTFELDILKLASISAIVLLSACGNLFGKKEALVYSQAEQQKTSLDFSSVQQMIFQPHCVSCHQQYDSYQGVIREISAIQSAVQGGRMPKSGAPLSQEQKLVLKEWIESGALESVEDKPATPVTIDLLPTWNSVSENLIFPKCLVCHNPQGQAKFLDLSTRQAIFKSRNRIFGDGLKLLDFESPEKSYLIEVLLDDEEPMPPTWSNIPRLTLKEIEVLKEWIFQGLP